MLELFANKRVIVHSVSGSPQWALCLETARRYAFKLSRDHDMTKPFSYKHHHHCHSWQQSQLHCVTQTISGTNLISLLANLSIEKTIESKFYAGYLAAYHIFQLDPQRAQCSHGLWLSMSANLLIFIERIYCVCMPILRYLLIVLLNNMLVCYVSSAGVLIRSSQSRVDHHNIHCYNSAGTGICTSGACLDGHLQISSLFSLEYGWLLLL